MIKIEKIATVDVADGKNGKTLRPIHSKLNQDKVMHRGFILLNCDLGAEEYVVDELKHMQNISNAYLTFGAYDVIAEIQTGNQDGFEKTISEIRKLSRVVSTMTLNIIGVE